MTNDRAKGKIAGAILVREVLEEQKLRLQREQEQRPPEHIVVHPVSPGSVAHHLMNLLTSKSEMAKVLGGDGLALVSDPKLIE